jgi:Domain of Unknown Function (DUF1080)
VRLLRRWVGILTALCLVAVASLIVIRRSGPTEPRVVLVHTECGRAISAGPKDAAVDVVVVEVRNVGETAVDPSLVLTAVELPSQRGDGPSGPVGRTLGARALGFFLALGASASVAIRLEDAKDACDERVQAVAAGASATTSAVTVNPATFIQDFDSVAPAALTTLENQARSRATWSIADGHLEAHGGGGALFSPQAWEDYDAEVNIMFPDGADNDAAILFRANDARNWYQMRIDASRVRLMAFVEGRLRTTATAEFAGVRPGRWHRLKVEVRGTAVKGYVDGALLLRYNGVQLAAGAVGVMQDDVRVRYADLVVRPIIGVARRR